MSRVRFLISDVVIFPDKSDRQVLYIDNTCDNICDIRLSLQKIMFSNSETDRGPEDEYNDRVNNELLSVINITTNFQCFSDLLHMIAITLLEEALIHKPNPNKSIRNNIRDVFKPHITVIKYAKNISDEDEREECIHRIYEFCVDIHPKYNKSFCSIVSTLVSGDILCPMSTARFIDAMLAGEMDERKIGKKLEKHLSNSCPW